MIEISRMLLVFFELNIVVASVFYCWFLKTQRKILWCFILSEQKNFFLDKFRLGFKLKLKLGVFKFGYLLSYSDKKTVSASNILIN